MAPAPAPMRAVGIGRALMQGARAGWLLANNIAVLTKSQTRAPCRQSRSSLQRRRRLPSSSSLLRRRRRPRSLPSRWKKAPRRRRLRKRRTPPSRRRPGRSAAAITPGPARRPASVRFRCGYRGTLALLLTSAISILQSARRHNLRSAVGHLQPGARGEPAQSRKRLTELLTPPSPQQCVEIAQSRAYGCSARWCVRVLDVAARLAPVNHCIRSAMRQGSVRRNRPRQIHSLERPLLLHGASPRACMSSAELTTILLRRRTSV
jgi:hypothetical protein